MSKGRKLGLTVVACPVCRGVERAMVREWREFGMLFGVVVVHAPKVFLLRCESCGVEMRRGESPRTHAEPSVGVERMLQAEEPDERERIIASADLYRRIGEGAVAPDERLDAIALVMGELADSGSTEVERTFSGMARLGALMSLLFLGVAAGAFFFAGGAAVWLFYIFVLAMLVGLVAVWRAIVGWGAVVEEKSTARALAPLEPTDEELAEAMVMVWPGMPSWALRLSVAMMRRDLGKVAEAA